MFEACRINTAMLILYSAFQTYSCAEEFWDHVKAQRAGQDAREEQQGEWYKAAVQYWDCQAATNDGVLGGFGQVNPSDIMDSRKFLMKGLMTRIQEAKEQGQSLVAAGTYKFYMLHAWQHAIRILMPILCACRLRSWNR